MSNKFNLIIIGSGPGGYVAAIRASQLGMNVAVIERESPGGICLNWGCIPTKALLKSAMVLNYAKHASDYGISLGDIEFDFKAIIARSRGVAEKMSKGIDYLLRKNKITLIKGVAKLAKDKSVIVDTEGLIETYQADNIIIATGARAKELPNVKIDGKYVIEYRKALSLDVLPKSMLVIGGGAIGVEFAYFYSSLGVEVILVEFLKQGLLPREDAEISKALGRSFKSKKIVVKSSTSVDKIDISEDKCKVTLHNLEKDTFEIIETDIVLSAVGISPNTEDIGLEDLGINTIKGFIQVDEDYRTNLPNIFAIGDVIPTVALAHVASAEGINCVEKLAGIKTESIDYDNIPSNVYCSPEIASVGLTEEKASEKYGNVKVGKFPFSASGKATASGDNEGFVKLIFEEKYGELVGAHMIGQNVTEMIAEMVLMKKLEGTAYELIKTIHPHPTISESIMEAAAAAYDEVIHL